MDPPKSIFWMAQLRVPVCFDISRYLTNKYFDIVWGCHPPGTSPNGPPKNIIFWTAQLRIPVFYDIIRYLTDKYFNRQIFWHSLGGHPPPRRLLQMDLPKINFFYAQLRAPTSDLWYQQRLNRQIFWLYFSGGSIIRYFWILANFTVNKKYFWASQH